MRLLFLVALGVSGTATAGECPASGLFHDGAHLVRTTYDAKGKETGRSVADVGTVAATADGFTAAMHITTFDAKGKEQGAVDTTVACAAGVLKLDLRADVSPETTEAYKDWTVTVQGGAIDYPEAPAPGERLPDASLVMTFSMPDAPPGMPTTAVTVNAKNRVVDGPESLTTPAGTFATTKLHYDSEVVTRTIVSMTIGLKVVEWYTPGLGTVKTETYKNDKLKGSTVLTEVR